MGKKSRKRFNLSWPEWTLFGIVAGACLAVLIALSGLLLDSPEEMAQKELVKLADDYYIRYLYPTLLGDVNHVDPAEKLQDFVELGTPTIFLRQLLHFENDKNISSTAVFTEVGCDSNRTSIKFYPVAPFGPRDYTIKYRWNCEKMPENENNS